MFQTINFYSFCDAFSKEREKTYTYKGKKALFEYLERLEEDTGEPMELDIIALCCDFTEYESAMEGAKAYGYDEVVDLEPHGSVDLLEVAELEEKQALEWLQDRTSVITIDGMTNIIIQNF